MILFNDIPLSAANFSEEIFKKGLNIYEVIRILDGEPIFLRDNIDRLNHSLKSSALDIDVQSLNLPDKLKRFIQLKNIKEGNVKYVLHFEESSMDEYLYQIPHSYPTAQNYQDGVATITHRSIRENPGVKYVNNNLRTLTNQLMQEHQVYEVLLIDQDGYVTEGSRSNVFFIKNDTLYTSPLEYVLPGTSRKRVFDICQQYQLPIVEQRIDANGLHEYEAAFITGTSPLILPICQIDAIRYKVDSPFLRQLMKYYFALLKR